MTSDQVAADVQVAMIAMGDYSQRALAIVRDAKDCDSAAKQLETLVPEFAELGPRIMKVRARMMALPAADRDRIQRESEQMFDTMKHKFADADQVVAKVDACEKSSKAFADVSPKVMFQKKH